MKKYGLLVKDIPSVLQTLGSVLLNEKAGPYREKVPRVRSQRQEHGPHPRHTPNVFFLWARTWWP